MVPSDTSIHAENWNLGLGQSFFYIVYLFLPI